MKIQVNEKGAEAAAVTALKVVGCCLMVEETKSFTADHPFLFMIVEISRCNVLFLGHMFGSDITG